MIDKFEHGKVYISKYKFFDIEYLFVINNTAYLIVQANTGNTMFYNSYNTEDEFCKLGNDWEEYNG